MKSDLSQFDNRLMNGLLFCKRTYDLYHKIRNDPDGESRIRLRKGKLEKKLLEELIPIARYIQSRYYQGRQIKIRWIDGGQNYDAKILVDEGFGSNPQFLEVTTVVHKYDHYKRKMIDEGLPTFGVKGILLEQKPKREKSEPYIYSKDEFQRNLSLGILNRIKSKNSINYPENTILVIQCFLDRGPITKAEWLDTTKKLESGTTNHKFFEVFVFESNGKFTYWL